MQRVAYYRSLRCRDLFYQLTAAIVRGNVPIEAHRAAPPTCTSSKCSPLHVLYSRLYRIMTHTHTNTAQHSTVQLGFVITVATGDCFPYLRAPSLESNFETVQCLQLEPTTIPFNSQKRSAHGIVPTFHQL